MHGIPAQPHFPLSRPLSSYPKYPRLKAKGKQPLCQIVYHWLVAHPNNYTIITTNNKKKVTATWPIINSVNKTATAWSSMKPTNPSFHRQNLHKLRNTPKSSANLNRATSTLPAPQITCAPRNSTTCLNKARRIKNHLQSTITIRHKV